MGLLRFPDEVLEMIAASLDFDSQVAFGRSNQRLQNAASKFVTVRRFSESVLEHLRENGHLVRTLDISNCKQLPTQLPEIVMGCSNITRLEVVNTQLSFMNLKDLLGALTKLESLSFSSTTLTRSGHMEVGSSTSLKNLYVEARPDIITLSWIIRLMNRLEVLQVAHVNLVGASTSPLERYCPTLRAKRWETLHTFVCSCYLAKPNYENVLPFLRSVFDSKSSTDIDRWCEEQKDCYVYEHGFVNTKSVDRVLVDRRVKLLKQFQVMDLERDSATLGSPWGHPQSLRIRHDQPLSENSDFAHLSGLFTLSLVELDLTDCHGIFSELFWSCLTDSSPFLESMALPLCFFIFPGENSDGTGLRGLIKSAVRPCGMARHEAENENRSLRRLKLKKLFLKATSEPFRQSRENPIGNCKQCCQPLDSRNLPKLEDLDNLEELTFNNVSFDRSALRNMSNSSAHTIRLNLKQLKDFSGMREFLANCKNLQNLKLSGLKSALGSTKLWKALAAAENLKQICLGASLPSSRTSFGKLELNDVLSQIPRTVVSFHFHVSRYDVTDSFKVTLFEYWSEKGRCESLSEMILLNHMHTSVGDEIRTSRLGKPFLGRSLCHSESFAGYVKPVQWTVSEA